MNFVIGGFYANSFDTLSFPIGDNLYLGYDTIFVTSLVDVSKLIVCGYDVKVLIPVILFLLIAILITNIANLKR